MKAAQLSGKTLDVMRHHRKLVLATLSLSLLLGVVYVGGIIFECEYPYWWVLWRVRSARLSSGGMVSDKLAVALGEKSKLVHWHTCSYSTHQHVQPGEVHVQFRDPEGSSQIFEFIYSRRTHTLRPANADAQSLLSTTGGNDV